MNEEYNHSTLGSSRALDITDIKPEENEIKEIDDSLKTNLGSILYNISAIAYPTTAYHLSLLLMETINSAFISRRYENKYYLDGIGITNVYLNCTLFSIFIGIYSGLETLCSNALGAKKYKLLGYYFQRARIIGCAIGITLIIIHIFTLRQGLQLFQLNDEAVEAGVRYGRCFYIVGLCEIQTVAIQRILNVLGENTFCFVTVPITLILHLFWNWLFLYKLDYGTFGTGLAMILSKLELCILNTVYLWFFHPYPEANFWINKKCFGIKGLWNYLKFSIGAGFLEIGEWWGFELVTVIAVWINNKNLETQGDCYSLYVLLIGIMNLFNSPSFGFMVAITVVIGSMIPVYSIKELKKAIIYSVSYACFVLFILALISFIIRDYIFAIFTKNEELRQKAKPILPFLMLAGFLNINKNFLSVFKGIGRQYFASIFLFINLYIITPGCIILFGVYLKYGIKGIFIGFSLGYGFITLLYFFLLLFYNYEKTQKETLERLRTDKNLILDDDDDDIKGKDYDEDEEDNKPLKKNEE